MIVYCCGYNKNNGDNFLHPLVYLYKEEEIERVICPYCNQLVD